MNDNFNEQKDMLLSIKHEISLLHKQVDFLLRNEKAVGLLDLDVMMNRTHTIYDKMCSIDLGGSPEAIDEESLINSFVMATEEPMAEEEPEPMVEEPEPEEEKPTFVEEEPEPEEELRFVEEEEDTLVEENEDAYFEEEVEDVEEEKPIEEKPAEVPHNNVDDLGFILNFEPSDEDEAPVEEENPSVYTTGDEIEMTIPQSLADKYQHDSLNDLRSAIGINDKFLLVNELFGGSMEKYNKSIDNLNDLKTLNGALVYMNELRVELQWNSNNEAYKRLLELVHRKFE
ncbi:MAG: hypothetical protein IKM74_07120 [Bacteroidales bacterium]|nr:hypothetical protein [Bacteroidales bacterium]